MKVDNYEWIRGFNYVPSYAGNLMQMWMCFDKDVWEREILYSKRFGTNTLRIWLDWYAYLVDEKRFLESLEIANDICKRNGIKMLPVLFNRWWDTRYPAGGIADNDLRYGNWEKFDKYIDDLLGNFGKDENILMWDLCNEPQQSCSDNYIRYLEYRWLSYITDRIKKKDNSIVITVGTMVGENVREYSALVDVISFHPYANSREQMYELIGETKQIGKHFDKPILCTETCKGALDDRERGEITKFSLEPLMEEGVGWLAWHLIEGKFVTANKKRVDSNSVKPEEGYMVFVLSDGRTRPYHNWLEIPK